MAADFNKPVTTDGYADVLGKLRDNDTALAVALDPAVVTPANIPTNAVRWTSAVSKWQRYNGTTWGDITPANNITGNAATATTAAACSGNAATATVLATARTIDGVSFNGSANIEVLAAATHAATSKGTPVDADEIPLADSAASFGLKRLTWANLKATLKTYFDTLYAKIGLITASGSTMTTGKLLGRSTATTGAVEEITLGTGLSFTGTTLNAAVSVSSVVGQTGAVTATQVRDALLAVDGAGSGLDADLLDGQNSGYYSAAGAIQDVVYAGTVSVAGTPSVTSVNLFSLFGIGVYAYHIGAAATGGHGVLPGIFNAAIDLSTPSGSTATWYFYRIHK